jgi:ketosteroid isomerase-like protein
MEVKDMNTGLQNNEARYQEAQALLQRYTQSLFTKDIDGWMSLLDDNFVIEFPFAPQGRPNRIEGKANLHSYIQQVLNSIEFVGIVQQQIHLAADADVMIVEITVEGRAPSMEKIHTLKYIWVLTTKDGKLIHQRDYWNPQAMLEVMRDATASQTQQR